MNHRTHWALACIAALCLFATACSDAGVNESSTVDTVSEQAEPLVYNYTATNGCTSLPSPSQYFCHVTRMVSSGGHSLQVLFPPYGLPAAGSLIGGDTSSVCARTNAGQTAPNTNARIDVQCDSWFNFHGNSSAGYTYTGAGLSWTHPGYASWVGGVQPLNRPFPDEICDLTYLGSFSWPDERAVLYVSPSTWLWELQVSGWKSLSGGARCATLGRPVSNHQWLNATPGRPGVSSLSPSQGVCLIYDVTGSLDDGGVRIVGNPMQLEASGTIVNAKAYCIAY